MKRGKLPSTREQLRILQQKNIITKQGRNPADGKKITSPWTIYRLYNFYITKKGSHSAPVAEAYGQTKRLYDRIEENTETRLATPKGAITGKKHIRNVDKRTSKRIDKELPAHVSMRYGRHYTTVKHVRDEFIYRIQPPIRANQQIRGSAERRAERVIDDIIRICNLMFSERRELYRNHAFGAIIMYRTNNIETNTGVSNPKGYIRAPWTRLPDIDLFRIALTEGFDTAFDILYKYPGGMIIIYRVDVYLSTLWKGTNIDFSRIRTG